MAITLLPAPKFTIHGDNGSLAAGWLVNTYEIGTTTPKATYTDAAGGTPNANPVELDERGEADIWWNGYYKIVVTRPDASGGWTVNNFGTPGLSGITDTSTTTQLTLTDTAATFNGDVIVLKDLIQKIGIDVASATVLTLGDGNIFDVTGVAPITSIASKGIGTVVYLQFDGILTLTHHATDLILPGADDIITAAGDQAVLYEYATADWRCVDFIKFSGRATVNSTVYCNNSNGNPNISETVFNLISAITESTWESVGPTGGGADDTWTALDSVPTDADWIEIRLRIYCVNNTSTSSTVSVSVYGRDDGSAQGIGEGNRVASVSAISNASGDATGSLYATVKIPVTSSICEFFWLSTFDFSSAISAVLTGYGYNE